MNDAVDRRNILYWFLVTSVPEGGAPEDIRSQWLNVLLPVRRPRPIEGPDPRIGTNVAKRHLRTVIPDGVVVELADAIRALVASGRDGAAAWWRALYATQPKPPALVFRIHEGTLMPASYAERLYPETEGVE